jgi:hypothetical protein
MSTSRTLAAALTLALMAAATSALASGVPVIAPSDLPTGGGTFGVSDWTSQFNSVSGSGSGSVTLGGAIAGATTVVPDANVQAAIGVTAETQLRASSVETVNFYINAPAGVSVPIIIAGLATGSGSGNGISAGGAYLETYNNDGRDAVTLFSFADCNSASCGGAFSRNFNLPTGFIFSVLLEASGFIVYDPTATVSGPGAFSADVDPANLISIDPTFAALNPGVSLAINSGSGPAPGVPEPASWALMIAGFGLAGAALRRRRTALA